MDTAEGERRIIVAMGDPRVRNPDALFAALRVAGFAECSSREFCVSYQGSSDELWEFFLTTYDLQMLPPPRVEQVRRLYEVAIESRWPNGGAMASLGLRLVEAR